MENVEWKPDVVHIHAEIQSQPEPQSWKEAQMLNTIIWLFVLVWAAPNSLLGVLVGLLGLLTGGKVQLRQGCLEFYGGFVSWALSRLPLGSVMAMTLGHTIIGQSANGLAVARDHEHVHVRQYERWGPMFIPA